MKKIFLIILLSACAYAQAFIKEPGIKGKSSFAIFIDKTTYDSTQNEVMSYKAAIEKEGLPTYLAAAEWKNPEEVKALLLDLYKKHALEGAVFIGNIPIAMIRDAQHLTSAYKIDQNGNWFNNSAPSDRFYDDFDLKFKFLKQDSLRHQFFYYSLTAESAQRIEKDIYTARIKPSSGTGNKYALMRDYLRKAVRLKSEKNYLDNMLVYSGQGYNSEALAAYTDEILALREQFPQMFSSVNGKLKKLNHSMSDDMKDILLTELQNPALDIAMFHAHGDTDAQLLVKYPQPRNAQENIADVKLFLRSKLREAKRRKKNTDELKNYFIKELGVTDSWFDGAFVDSVIAKDSVLEASLDIYISDIRQISPQSKLFIFDECFNGSFQEEDYIAADYVFGKGSVIAGIGNTTNALQDQWIAQLMGLLSKGLNVGQWHMFNTHLESHIIGDPTLRFTANETTDIARLTKAIPENIKTWEKLLGSTDPNMRELALAMLYKMKGKDFIPKVKSMFDNDPAYIVRLHALMCLCANGGNDLIEALKKGINDPYEAIRRFSASLMNDVGSEEFIPYLVKAMLTDESERVVSNARNSLEIINPLLAMEATNKEMDRMPAYAGKEKTRKLLNYLFTNESRNIEELVSLIKSDTVKLKLKLRELRTFRGYNYKTALTELIDFAENQKYDNALRKVAIEALGWYTAYYKKSILIEACKRIINAGKNSEEIRSEALKTLNRLNAGLNDPLIP